ALARLAGRGMGPDAARQRIEAQGPDLVDRLVGALSGTRWRRIDTSGSREATRDAVRAAFGAAIGAR
ncbi:MAG TPA: hypothetical protein VFM38_01990, partial [Candidatus Limnocylindrales bacterium]|nr:hypothetical protein [Candidatus Limnocylindrales bacterium]